MSPEPNLEFELIFLTNPPTTSVGSKLASDSKAPIIEDVEVFPCVPPTAILVFFKAISSPSISARFMIGICISTALASSTLSIETALE